MSGPDNEKYKDLVPKNFIQVINIETFIGVAVTVFALMLKMPCPDCPDPVPCDTCEPCGLCEEMIAAGMSSGMIMELGETEANEYESNYRSYSGFDTDSIIRALNFPDEIACLIERELVKSKGAIDGFRLGYGYLSSTSAGATLDIDKLMFVVRPVVEGADGPRAVDATGGSPATTFGVKLDYDMWLPCPEYCF